MSNSLGPGLKGAPVKRAHNLAEGELIPVEVTGRISERVMKFINRKRRPWQ
jgi:hypothetical protein